MILPGVIAQRASVRRPNCSTQARAVDFYEDGPPSDVHSQRGSFRRGGRMSSQDREQAVLTGLD